VPAASAAGANPESRGVSLPVMTPLQSQQRDHVELLRAAADVAGLTDPVAFDPDEFQDAMLKGATRGPVRPAGAVLIRDWFRHSKKTWPGVEFGIRPYDLGSVKFCHVNAPCDDDLRRDSYDFFAVGRADYTRLYRLALLAKKADRAADLPPVLADETFATLRRNTVDYLAAGNLARVKDLGGRPRRGLLLAGPPGNGKTSACRWVRRQCEERGLEHKVVSPDDYRTARSALNAAAAVKALFQVERAGVVFFDDLDIALRDRAGRDDTEDQAVFLGAIDGMEVNAGVAYIFTTNLALDLIDPAFRRPGRIDVLLHLPKPPADLRRRLVDRWHPELLAAVDPARVVAETDGLSFAEVDELKNLLVLRYTEVEAWDWPWAQRQFRLQRDELAGADKPRVGFAAPARNGTH